MNIDWSKAPEWANAVVSASHGSLYFVEDFGLRSNRRAVSNNYDCDIVADMTIEGHQWQLIEERPKKQEAWDGEGLPPVGAVCEWKEKSGFQWVAATILFITESSVVCKRSDGFEWQMLTKRTVFRPIKTAEQLAEEEIQSIRDEIRWIKPQLGPCPVSQLYHKGYRKQ